MLKFNSQNPRLIPLLLFLLLFLAKATARKTVVTTVTTSPASPTPPSYTSHSLFKDTVLSYSNHYRKIHRAPPLTWNDTLASYAKNWADRCIWKHSYGPYGENLASGYPNASAAICAWVDEGSKYNYHKPTGFTEQTGHFTQLVWKDTTDVGCAAVDCEHASGGKLKVQGWFVVCEYFPAGNVVGRHNALFKANVLPPKKHGGSSNGGSSNSGSSNSGSSNGGSSNATCPVVKGSSGSGSGTTPRPMPTKQASWFGLVLLILVLV